MIHLLLSLKKVVVLFVEINYLQNISEPDLNIKQKDVSQKERKSSNDNLANLDGPIIEDNLDNLCNLCHQ